MGESALQFTPAKVASPARWHRDKCLWALALLPWLVAAINPSWLFTPFGCDPWVYFGYYLSLPDYLHTFDGLYYSSRLSVTVPGWLAYRCLPPLAANLVLRLGLYYFGTISLYCTLRETAGRRAAFFGALGMGCYHYFLVSVGQDYTAGYGIAYLSLAYYCLVRAWRPGAWKTLWLTGAGAAAAAVVVANLLYMTALPFLACSFLAARPGQAPTGGQRLRRLGESAHAAAAAAAGAAGLVLALGVFNAACGGGFWFLLPSVKYVLFYTADVRAANVWWVPLRTWAPQAVWLVMPGLACLQALIYLGGRLFRWRGERHGRVALFYQLQILGMVGVAAGLHWKGHNTLSTWYMLCTLVPATYLALATQWAPVLDALTGRQARLVAAVALLLLLLPLTISGLGAEGRVVFVATFAAAAAAAGWACWAGPYRRAAVTATAAVGLLGAGNLVSSMAYSVRDGRPRLAYLLPREGTDYLAPLPCGAAASRWSAAVEAALAVRAQEKSGNVWFWYDRADPAREVAIMAASTHLWMYRLVNEEFPRLPAAAVAGQPLPPGVKLAVVSSRPDALELARLALRQHGFEARLLAKHAVGDGAARTNLLVLEASPAPGEEPLEAAWGGDDGPGTLRPGGPPDGSLPADRWRPSGVGDGFHMAARGGAWQVTTCSDAGSAALDYAPLSAGAGGVHRFQIHYHRRTGDVAFFAMRAGTGEVLGVAGPGVPTGAEGTQKSLSVELKPGDAVVLRVSNANPGGPSSLDLRELRGFIRPAR